MNDELTDWMKLKLLAESGDEDAIAKYEEAKLMSRSRRKKSYHNSLRRFNNKWYDGRGTNQLRKTTHREVDKPLEKIWRDNNRSYLKMYRRQWRKGYYYNKKVHQAWLEGDEKYKPQDPNSPLLKLDKRDFPIQRRRIG